MKLDAYLRAHAFMKVERPPELWEVDCDDEPFLYLLGEMIVLGLLRDNDLAELVLNVSNTTVDESAAGDHLAQGDYVAMTVRGKGDWGEEATWWPGAETPAGELAHIIDRLRAAGALYAYSRNLDDEGSVTVFLPRLTER